MLRTPAGLIPLALEAFLNCWLLLSFMVWTLLLGFLIYSTHPLRVPWVVLSLHPLRCILKVFVKGTLFLLVILPWMVLSLHPLRLPWVVLSLHPLR